jgi:hypothetical protein
MPNYHYSLLGGGVYRSGLVYFPRVVETSRDYLDIREQISEEHGGAGTSFVLLNLQLLDDPGRVARLQSALAEAIDYLERSPFNYDNGVIAPDGVDEGATKGWKAHNRLLKRLKKVLKG